MADLSIKNIPTELHHRLKKSAKENHRSLNREAIYRMELGLHAIPQRTPAQVEQILSRARKLRRRLKGVWLTGDEIIAAKNEGRR